MSVATLWDTIEPYLAAENVELDDLQWSGRVLKVIVDADGGVDVDRIAELSRGMARMLDEDPSLADSYTLEVSSPGLERSLRRPSHYRKAVGREVAITTTEAVDGETYHRGPLASYDDETLTIEIAGSPRSIDTDLIKEARTVFTWKPAAKPGKKGS